MDDRRALRGMTWGHDRGIAPLLATAAEWERATGTPVRWRSRTLKEFGEVPLSDLVEDFDLLVIDHPFVGRAAAADLVHPLDDLLDAGFLAEQAAGSIGGSHASYTWDGRQYALAVDAAAQVQAVRPDLLGDRPVPRTWPEVLDLAAAGVPVGVPTNATDVVPTFLSLCGALGDPPFPAGGGVVPAEQGLAALDLLRRLAAAAVPWTLDANPIQLLERMAGADEVAVAPVLFGYTNYSRAGYRPHPVAFSDLPGTPPDGSTLGGAGLAVSRRSRAPWDAAAYARFVAEPHTQAGTYVRSGGQPAHRAAWEDPAADALTGGFFSGTRATMDGAFVRPRHAGYLTWQDTMGPVLARAARGAGEPAAVLAELERAYAACAPAPQLRRP